MRENNGSIFSYINVVALFLSMNLYVTYLETSLCRSWQSFYNPFISANCYRETDMLDLLTFTFAFSCFDSFLIQNRLFRLKVHV